MIEHRRLTAAGVGIDLVSIGGTEPGPRVAVLGGVHGDELEGIVAAGQLVARLRTASVQGQVDVVAVANPLAHAALRRTSPDDDANLARVFPGAADGSPTQRIADLLTREVIFPADLLVDLHSAGAHYEMPVFVGFDGSGPTAVASRAAAEAFGAPVVWRHSAVQPGRSISTAAAAGVASIYVEGSGGGGLRGADLDVYLGGTLRVLARLGVIAAEHADVGAPATDPVHLDGGDGDVDSSLAGTVDGLCVTRAEIGADLDAGDVVAEIVGIDGTALEVLRAPRAGRLMMLRRTAAVRRGDGIAMLGPAPSPSGGGRP